MKLLFQASNGSERVIAEVDSQDDVMAEINKFCNETESNSLSNLHNILTVIFLYQTVANGIFALLKP